MNRIETCVLNPTAIAEAENMMVCAARLTQRGHTVKCMRGFMDLYEKEHTAQTVANLANLPHPTLQKFAVINVAVVGASRRFLAQITRHQNEVKFMSASLQYSDYSDEADFVVPYELLNSSLKDSYILSCEEAIERYKQLAIQRKEERESLTKQLQEAKTLADRYRMPKEMYQSLWMEISEAEERAQRDMMDSAVLMSNYVGEKVVSPNIRDAARKFRKCRAKIGECKNLLEMLEEKYEEGAEKE